MHKPLYLIVILLLISTMETFSAFRPGSGQLVTGKYIVIANPTARNIETVQFLTENQIFRVNTAQVHFIGIYHPGQSYDFEQSRKYIEENRLSWISLLEMDCDLNLENIYGENGCTEIFRDIFRRSAGTIFFGGPDIQPEAYGEENLWSVVTDPARHLLELSYAFHLTGGSQNTAFQPFLSTRPDYLVTGFCLGMQTMNVAAGGTLWQDIPAQVYQKEGPEQTVQIDRNNLHRNYWQLISKEENLMTINLHHIRFTSHPFFTKTIGAGKNSKPRIYSSHHQAPKKVGEGFEVTALSPDGKIIEGLAHSKFPNVFAVQFHPEVPALYENREEWKFAPRDKPRTMHRIIRKSGVRFHRKYWDHISKVVNQL